MRTIEQVEAELSKLRDEMWAAERRLELERKELQYGHVCETCRHWHPQGFFHGCCFRHADMPYTQANARCEAWESGIDEDTDTAAVQSVEAGEGE